MPKIDILVYNHGSVWTIEAASKRAEKWVRAHVAVEPWSGTAKRFSGDWRPMRDIVVGADSDGLVVAEA